MDAQPVISARALRKSFPGGIRAVDDLDLYLRPGEWAALIGPNGSGKSTLLNLLAGGLEPDGGEILPAPSSQAGGTARRPVFLPQHQSLDPEMTLSETLRLFASLHGMRGREGREKVSGLISAFGLDPFALRLVSRCSGGVRQRLHIAIAFLPESALLLLDEPTVSLDPFGREAFWRYLAERSRLGAAALIALHDLQEASSRCGRILLLHQGRIRADGAPAALIAEHGAWIWNAVLAGVPADADALRHTVSALPGISVCGLDAEYLTVRMRADGPDDATLVGALAAAGTAILAYERRRPDLDSVFQALAPPGLVGGEGGPGTRSSHARRGNKRGHQAGFGRRWRGDAQA